MRAGGQADLPKSVSCEWRWSMVQKQGGGINSENHQYPEP